jgi:beta-xylosidase
MSLTESVSTAPQAWRDPARAPAERAQLLLADLTLEEKVAQLVGLWVGADPDGGVAPNQSQMTDAFVDWDRAIRDGLGQLTRPFGTAPVEPAVGARALAQAQRAVVAASRFGIPALVHEECLTGFAAWRATTYPAPPSWGASFDPGLVEEVAAHIGGTMRVAGVHQGLAPVLDVTRDYRWGRTEESISEDPYLVSAVGAAYVRGLESAGIISTLKHFAGYAASRAGRNLAPASIGPRELADVVLAPFEAALRHGGARSVMNAYNDIDGVPAAADPTLLTTLLRDEWGFDGTVVADYFSVRFLQTLHAVAGSPGEAAAAALRAGIDVELPSGDAYLDPLIEEVRAGRVDEALVDRAVLRVLTQKAQIGLLDPDWQPDPQEPVVLDDEKGRDLALRLAREAVVLVENRGAVLPLSDDARVALVGPLADDQRAVLGCYTFPNHVLPHHPGVEIGIEIPTLLAELTARAQVRHSRGCDVTDPSTDGFAEAVEAARGADVCVVAVGDRSGLFGRGTSGEGCDAPDLRLPGVQQQLLEAMLETGTPVVVVLLSGRPYALGPALDRVAAVVQAYFPGQLGARAVAEVLTGETSPTGRLPMSMPREPGSQPATYLSAPLGLKTGVSNIDPTPAYPFGHGLGYTTFDWQDGTVDSAHWPIDGEVEVGITVTNTGARSGTEVVQLYLHDPVAQVARPHVRLIGFARVPLGPGESARVRITVPADVTSFVGRDGARIVEAGDVELRISRSSSDVVAALPVRLMGASRPAGTTRQLFTTTNVEAS